LLVCLAHLGCSGLLLYVLHLSLYVVFSPSLTNNRFQSGSVLDPLNQACRSAERYDSIGPQSKVSLPTL
jgi:hypothetical protein